MSDINMSGTPSCQTSIPCPFPLPHTGLCHPTGYLAPYLELHVQLGTKVPEILGPVTSSPGWNVDFSSECGSRF